MAEKNIFPTKGNLIIVKNSLELAKQGYELMDKKRNILIRELMNLNEEAKAIQSEINETFTNAYEALQQANIEVGIHYVQEISHAVPIESSIRIKTRSIMASSTGPLIIIRAVLKNYCNFSWNSTRTYAFT